MSQKKVTSNRGFTLVSSIVIFLTFQTVIVGSLYNMMRLQRQVQHASDDMKMNWAAEAVIERTVKLIEDYVDVTGSFPDRLDRSSNRLRGGIDTGPTNELTDSEFQDFDQYLIKWYRNKIKTKPNYQSALSTIDVNRVNIFQVARDDVNNVATYSIEVTANKIANGTNTPFQVTITQGLRKSIDGLPDIAVFCSGDCELAAGPDFTLQGPIYSNGDIYIGNDAVDQTINPNVYNTLTLTLADTFNHPVKRNPQPYLMHARGNTYFYFKRFVGNNPYLAKSNIYYKSVPQFYKWLDPSKPESVESVRTPVIHQGFSLNSYGGKNIYPPRFYYGTNEANCNYDINGEGCKSNRILFDLRKSNVRSLDWLAHSGESVPLPKMWPAFNVFQESFTLYTPTNHYGEASMSVSSAFDPSLLTILENLKPKINHKWTQYWEKTEFQTQYPEPFLVKDQAAPKEIKLGRAILEAVIDSTDEAIVKENKEKLHSMATISLINGRNCPSNDQINFCKNTTCVDELETCRDTCPAGRSGCGCLGKYGTCQTQCETCSPEMKSPQFEEFIEKEILIEMNAPDFRNGHIGYALDIQKMITNPTINLGAKPLVYFSVSPPTGTAGKPALKIINGYKLPEQGLTIVSDGRIWIQGDYNIFEYSEEIHRFEGPHFCSQEEWDGTKHSGDDSGSECHPPPAAIFSDSFGVLSWEWKDNTTSRFNEPLLRPVRTNVTVNTMLATGYKKTELVDLLSERQLCTGSDQEIRDHSNCFPNLTTERRIVYPAQVGGELLYSQLPNTGKRVDHYTFRCPDNSYNKGLHGVNPVCEYYREADDVYHYYVNPRSRYRNADGTESGYDVWSRKPGSQLPSCDVVPGDANKDMKVDAADQVLWRKNKEKAGPDLPGDFDRNHVVDDADYIIWKANFGTVSVNCSHVRIPIFADQWTNPNTPIPVPPFPGVYFSVLDRTRLTSIGTKCIRKNAPLCPDEKLPIFACVRKPGESTDRPPNTCCSNGDSPGPGYICEGYENGEVGQGLVYIDATYYPVHRVSYSGGLENLINLQEDWTGRTLRFLGTLSVPWEARYLKEYRPDYYFAPKRIFDYNEDLRFNRPPGTPDLSSARRTTWSRKYE